MMNDKEKLIEIMTNRIERSTSSSLVENVANDILAARFKREDCCSKYINGAFNSVVRCSGGDWNMQKQFPPRRFIYCPECGGRLGEGKDGGG